MSEAMSDLSDSEVTTLSALFDDDADLTQLVTLLRAESAQEQGKTAEQEIESMLRERWGMNHIDLEREASAYAKDPGRIEDKPNVEDDFTDEEWLIVRGLRDHCRKVVRTTMGAKQRNREVKWAFQNGVEDDKGLSFHKSCIALQTRPFVVQTLIQHYWGIRDIVVGELPFLADPLPDPLYTEALFHAGEVGGEIAKASWMSPGDTILTLESTVREAYSRGTTGMRPPLTQKWFDQAMGDLQESGLLKVSLGRAHFISRPPAMRKFRRSSWSRSFVFED